MKPILVLNADYMPLSIANFKKAFKLICKGKAEVVFEDITSSIRTERTTYSYPSIIRLVKFVTCPYKKVVLTRQNIFKRDKHTCAYCSGKKNLTIDHIFPKSRGGKDTWENLITSCSSCNMKKDNKTPEEASMKLKFKPFRPNQTFFLANMTNPREEWKPYLMN